MTTDVIVTGTSVPHSAPGRAGAGVLVGHDRTLLRFDADRATTLQLAADAVAAAIDVPTLVSTHLVPAPRDEADEAAVVQEITAAGHAGRVAVARDLTEVSL